MVNCCVKEQCMESLVAHYDRWHTTSPEGVALLASLASMLSARVLFPMPLSTSIRVAQVTGFLPSP